MLGLIAFLCAAFVAWSAWHRRFPTSRPAIGYGIAALLLLVLTAGDLHILWKSRASILVLVDESPSVRGAGYLDEQSLRSRLAQLLGNVDFHIERFGKDVDQTVLPPAPDMDAVVLFSDGQFALPPAYPPVYAVIDPAIAAFEDSQVRRLSIHNRNLAALIRNDGSEKPVRFSSDLRSPQTAPPGQTTILESLSNSYTPVVVTIDSPDRWPENNALTLQPPQPYDLEKWWLGNDAPDETWRAMTSLPADPGEYLRPAVIVADAALLDAAPVQRLEQYARDLGGLLIVRGSSRSIDSILPLSAIPPATQTRWVLLCDQSGSMASQLGEQSRAQFALDAIFDLLPHLPPEDVVDLGTFARDLSWISSGKSIRQTIASAVKPAAQPLGPTNLEPILASLEFSDSTHLLILTDGQAQFRQPVNLLNRWKQQQVRPFVLIVGETPPDASLKQFIESAGGSLMHQPDVRQWTRAMQSLAQSALPPPTLEGNRIVQFRGDLESLPPRSIPRATRAWQKPDSQLLAETNLDEARIPLAAHWHIGEGSVIQFVFPATPAEISSAAQRWSRPPRDPRLRITVEAAESVEIRVDARTSRAFLNDLSLSAQVTNAMPLPIPQTAPGEYRLNFPAPRSPALLTIRVAGRIVERVALAGRYAPEFDHIGLNRDRLKELSNITGGGTVEPADTSRLPIARLDYHSVQSWCAALSAAALGMMLVMIRLHS